MQEPLESAELLAFARTVDSRSLSRAAIELGVPRATISRRLARLEERLGVRLLRRTTRSLKLTDAGEALYRHAQIVLDAVENAEASVRRTDDAVRGDLRVSVPPRLTEGFRKMILDFVEKYPELRVSVHASTRFVDLVRDGYDVAIRAGAELEPGLIARTLATDRSIAVASPAYLERHGVPRTRRDLAQHRCLMGFEKGELPQTQWSFGRFGKGGGGGGGGGGKISVKGVFFANDVGLLAEAALHGQGIAFLPLMIVRPLLEDGGLVHVLPGVLERHVRVSVVYPEREFVPPQVRAFVDAVVAWAPTEFAIDIPAKCREEAAKRGRGKVKEAA